MTGRWIGGRTSRVLTGALAALVGAGSGCGGICDATAADLEGTYTIEVRDDDGSVDGRVVVTIDADGNVDAEILDSDGNRDGSLDCDVENDEVCDLEVRCRDDEGNLTFSFTVEAE